MLSARLVTVQLLKREKAGVCVARHVGAEFGNQKGAGIGGAEGTRNLGDQGPAAGVLGRKGWPMTS